MNEDQQPNKKTAVVGRTWVDLLFTSGYGFIILAFIGLVLFLGYRAFGSIPQWVFLSLGMSLIFIPFLFERAKEDSKIFVVVDQPLRLTEYRIGSKVELDIEGIGVQMQSKTGVRRTILKEFDLNSLTGLGSPLGDYSQFEQIRNMNTLMLLTNKLEEVLKEDRLTSMQIGIEVENQSKKIVDWALRFAYGSAIPEELTEALEIGIDNIDVPDKISEIAEVE